MAGTHDDLISAVSGAFNDRVMEKLQPFLTKDVVFDWSRSIGPTSGIYEGRDRVQELFDEYMDPWIEVDWRVTDRIELPGDRLLVVTAVRAHGRESGIEIDARGTQVWTFGDDGLVSRVTLFQDKESALAELGLSEDE
jgi:hypothetical protein